jgi:hypothetical protein
LATAYYPHMAKGVTRYETPHPVLYRGFDNADYANQFAMGVVRVSTLEYCRATEDGVRRDKDEGVDYYHTGELEAPRDDPRVKRALAQHGLDPDTQIPPGRVIFKFEDGVVLQRKIPDLYLLCLSSEIVEVMGPHFVRIDMPREYFEVLGDRLLSKGLILKDGALAQVFYRESRDYKFEDPNWNPAFVKPRNPFVREHEWRMAWSPSRQPIEPVVICCPTLRRYVSRVPAAQP